MHNPKTGKRVVIIDATPSGDIEVPKPRPANAKVPCETQAGCPKGHWKKPRGFCDRSRRVYQHYLECRAVGDFPKDPMVRMNAATIYAAEQSIARIDARKNALLAAGCNLGGL